MSGEAFRGIDPDGLVGLACGCDHTAECLGRTGASVARIAGGDPISRLMVARRALTAAAADLRWRSELIIEARDLAPFLAGGAGAALEDAGEFAARVGFDHFGRAEALREWTTAPAVTELLRLAPAAVARRLDALSPRLRRELVLEWPVVVGGLDGAPPAMRYAANRILINRHLARLREAVDAGGADSGSGGGVPTSSPSFQDAVAAAYAHAIDELQRWLAEDRQILLFDPRGDGRAVEVFGDLETARNVAIIVPGARNDLGRFSTSDGGFRATARNLKDAVGDGGEGTATVAWLGYDAPDGVDALWRDAAEKGSRALRRFVDGIDPDNSRHVGVIGHSYGSVVAGLAAAGGLDINELVFVGSPGTTLDAASGAELRADGGVWAGIAPWDPVGAGIGPNEAPPRWLPGALKPIWFLLDLNHGGVEELWHGTNPVAAEFGANVFATDGAAGHGAYFDPGTDSLANLARIVTGRRDEVVSV
jgi:hypothetical protein